MSESTKRGTSRRAFLKNTGQVAGAAVLAEGAVPHVHAGENNTIQLALVGCGGRGTGAAADALRTTSGPIKLVAMADVFPRRLAASHGNLERLFPKQIDVPQDRRFIGFDAYQKAIRQDKPHNEAKRGAEASLVQIMGRMACHTGRVITWDEAINDNHEFAPNLDKFTMDSPAPLHTGPDGKYPMPQPGIITDREF